MSVWGNLLWVQLLLLSVAVHFQSVWCVLLTLALVLAQCLSTLQQEKARKAKWECLWKRGWSQQAEQSFHLPSLSLFPSPSSTCSFCVWPFERLKDFSFCSADLFIFIFYNIGSDYSDYKISNSKEKSSFASKPPYAMISLTIQIYGQKQDVLSKYKYKSIRMHKAAQPMSKHQNPRRVTLWSR